MLPSFRPIIWSAFLVYWQISERKDRTGKSSRMRLLSKRIESFPAYKNLKTSSLYYVLWHTNRVFSFPRNAFFLLNNIYKSNLRSSAMFLNISLSALIVIGSLNVTVLNNPGSYDRTPLKIFVPPRHHSESFLEQRSSYYLVPVM